MGWMGDMNAVLNALRVVGADRDEQGQFVIYGEPVVTFLGLGEEAVIPDGTEYAVGGQRRNLAALMNGTSQGMRGVTVL